MGPMCCQRRQCVVSETQITVHRVAVRCHGWFTRDCHCLQAAEAAVACEENCPALVVASSAGEAGKVAWFEGT